VGRRRIGNSVAWREEGSESKHDTIVEVCNLVVGWYGGVIAAFCSRIRRCCKEDKLMLQMFKVI